MNCLNCAMNMQRLRLLRLTLAGPSDQLAREFHAPFRRLRVNISALLSSLRKRLAGSGYAA